MEQITFSSPVKADIVFQYYDKPLMFISNEIDGTHHFFYYIDDRDYFWAPVTNEITNIIADFQTTDDVMSALIEHHALRVIRFQSEALGIVYDLDEYEAQFGDVSSDFISSLTNRSFVSDTSFRIVLPDNFRFEIPNHSYLSGLFADPDRCMNDLN